MIPNQYLEAFKKIHRRLDALERHNFHAERKEFARVALLKLSQLNQISGSGMSLEVQIDATTKLLFSDSVSECHTS